MTKSITRIAIVASLTIAVASTAACTSDQVVDNSVGAAAGATKMAVKGVIGAGKLAYEGGAALIGSDN